MQNLAGLIVPLDMGHGGWSEAGQVVNNLYIMETCTHVWHSSRLTTNVLEHGSYTAWLTIIIAD